MKTIILCGGMGTRLKEETEFKPKPMVQIGGKPILWHIMKIYRYFGFREFILALGYKGEMIKEYFLNFSQMQGDFTLDLQNGQLVSHKKSEDDFVITFVETGLKTETGGRILNVSPYLDDGPFMVTFGDGVGDINLQALLRFHRQCGKLGTITGVHPHSKYGLIRADGDLVKTFQQKPLLHDYVSGGFMVFEKKALSFFTEGNLEDALLQLMQRKELALFPHDGFWKAMDTAVEMMEIQNLWEQNRPWAVWEKEPRQAVLPSYDLLKNRHPRRVADRTSKEGRSARVF